MKYDALIFDVDNVLIDTTGSFPVVIRTAIQWIWKRFLGRSTDCTAFSLDHFRLMKSYPYFNDDYDIAWILANITASAKKSRLSDSFPSTERLGTILDEYDGSDTQRWLSNNFGESVPRKLVRKLCAEIYYGAEAFAQVTGKEPSYIKCKGLWKFEKPNIKCKWTELALPAGIYTGRYRDELVLALNILEWDDFPQDLAVTADQGIKKPSSKGLEILCERLKSRDPAYFGDAGSDMESMNNLGFGTFIAIGNVIKDAPIRYPDLDTALRSLEMI